MRAALTGMYSKGQLLDALDKAAFEQPVGEVGPVVETEGGFFILLVTDRNPR